jgi:hypothetical protein
MEKKLFKLTKEIVNQRIADRGITLVGEYSNAQTKTAFACSNGHTWDARPHNILSGKGCRICVIAERTLTKEIINEKLHSRGITIIGDYKNCRSNARFKCSNNHEWHERVTLSRVRCPTCNRNENHYTKEKINKILKPRGITMSGEFRTVDHKTSWTCSDGHTWITRPTDILTHHKTGCPHCRKLTKEIINERLAQRGIKLVGKYIQSNTKATFKCKSNHEWTSRPGSVLFGDGCPQCATNAVYTTEEINQRLAEHGNGITLIGNYVNGSTSTTFRCKKGHEWTTKASHVTRGASGCPHCSHFGFKSSLPGSLYILHFKLLGYIKYGITNYFEQRYHQLSKQHECELLHRIDFENGMDAFLIERAIKQNFGTRYATKEELPDGWTETLPESMKDELLEILKAV